MSGLAPPDAAFPSDQYGQAAGHSVVNNVPGRAIKASPEGAGTAPGRISKHGRIGRSRSNRNLTTAVPWSVAFFRPAAMAEPMMGTAHRQSAATRSPVHAPFLTEGGRTRQPRRGVVRA